MRERPILFRGPMVRAILAGHKTQTRRIVKPWVPSYPTSVPKALPADFSMLPDGTSFLAACPYGQPGDRLWVRESTHRRPMLNLLTGDPLADKYDGGAYTADGVDVLTPEGFDLAWWYSRKSCPSIHMPRFACRLELEVTGVRVERLNDISDSDCWAEGIEECDGALDEVEICHLAKAMGRTFEDPQPSYAALWEQINGTGSWEANPWVWVVEFRRIEDGGAHG